MELIVWVAFSDASISTFGVDLLGPFSYDLIRTISTFGIDLWVAFSDALIITISTFGIYAPQTKNSGGLKRGSGEPDGPGVHWVAGR